jgi:beta-glucosidase
VDLEDGRIVTPLEAIRQRAAASTTVMFAQGSLGDVPLPVVPSSAFSLPDGSGPGVELHRMGADATPRIERVTNIDITLEADDVDAVLPALIRCRLTSESSGPHRLSLDLGGGAVVRVNGLEVMAGVREASPFFHGPACPLQGIVELTAGQAVDLEIEWRIASALIVPQVGLLPRITLGWQNQATQHDEAIAVARSQDAAVVIVNMASSEGMDRSSLDLPGDQDALIAAVAAVNPQTIVILNTPGAVMMPWLDDVAAVLQVWYPGEQFGPALASMLFGDSSPGGRLPLTFARSGEDLSVLTRSPTESPDVTALFEGNRIGYRAVGINERGALFPFGFGLSYGQTSHEVRTVRVADDIDIEMTVVNKATVAAPHVIQAYTYSSADPGQRFLSGIARTVVPPHSTVNLTLRVNRRDLDEVAPPDLRRLVIATHAFDPGIAVEEATPPSLAAPTSPTSETNEE